VGGWVVSVCSASSSAVSSALCCVALQSILRLPVAGKTNGPQEMRLDAGLALLRSSLPSTTTAAAQLVCTCLSFVPATAAVPPAGAVSCLDRLETFLHAIESFFHPSNTDMW
jgi:hypothetical protein